MNTNTSEANYRRVRVVVIGAGASGLQCANQLLQVDGENDNTSSIRPEDILILEARDRIGGRIHSTLETRKSCGNDSSQVQFYMDHGAAWIHGTGGDWPYFNPQPDLLESTAAALEENPMMELLKQVSAPDENVCEAHLNPTFKEGNPWMRPNHVLLKQKQLVLFVKGTQIGGSGCDSSSKASESSSEDDKIFSEALELHKNIMADVARIGYDLVSNGKTVDAVTQSFQTALDTVLASEKDNLLISTNNNPLIPLVAGFYRHLISCWHATDASDLQLYEFSAFDPGNETDEAVDDEYVDEGDFYGPHCTMKRGMETVLQPLVEKVLPCVRLNEPVISVGREQLITSVTGDNRNRSVRVETATGLVVEADCCVVTVSQGCLADALTKKEDDEQHQNQGNTTICFAEELSSQKIEAVENICMGSYKKVFLTFDHIFWPKYEAFIGLVREQQGSNKLLVEDHLGDNLLLDNLWARHDIPCIEAVLIGEAAVWATGKSDDIIRDAVLKFFSDTMGLDFETQPKEWCMDCHVTRWEEDPYSRGAYSGYRLGTSPRHTEGLASSEWGRQLVFAGEATVSGYEGSVHAALLSGKRAAKEVKDWLNSAAHRQQPDPKTSTNITHTIAVVAKCPIPGKSKTRLLGMLGEQGSAKLARAMLSDVLTSLSETSALYNVRKALFYAPANEEGYSIMKELLDTLNLRETSSSSIINDNDKNGWMLLPMTMSTNLESSNLGGILTDILRRIRTDLKGGSEGKVMFLGMDLPELPLEEIVASLGLDMAGNPSVDDGVFDTALLCPASDGGYGMLCIPPKAPTDTIFQGIRWSDPLTALSQLKVLSDCHIPIRLGRLMNDIDEPEDVQALCQRISKQQQRGGTVRNDYYPEEDNDALTKSAPGSSTAQTGSCRYTIKALTELGLLFTKQKS